MPYNNLYYIIKTGITQDLFYASTVDSNDRLGIEKTEQNSVLVRTEESVSRFYLTSYSEFKMLFPKAWTDSTHLDIEMQIHGYDKHDKDDLDESEILLRENSQFVIEIVYSCLSEGKYELNIGIFRVYVSLEDSTKKLGNLFSFLKSCNAPIQSFYLSSDKSLLSSIDLLKSKLKSDIIHDGVLSTDFNVLKPITIVPEFENTYTIYIIISLYKMI